LEQIPSSVKHATTVRNSPFFLSRRSARGKNAQDEWTSKTEWHRVCVFRPRLAEHVAAAIKKGAHVLIEGSLVSSTYEQSNGKNKKAKTAKITSWSIRADVVRKLDRGEPELEAPTSSPAASGQAPESSGEIHY